MQISLFIPCFVDQLAPAVGLAMATVLERLGHTVVYPAAQTCCGQPAFNSGYQREACQVAEHFLKVFADAEVVAVPSGSCAAMVRKFYPGLFAETDRLGDVAALANRTFEFSELLADHLSVTDVGARFPARVTYHDGCHSLRELGIRDAPRRLLGNVAGLELVEMDEAESCCGFGGTFSVKFPQVSTSMAGVKLASVQRAEVDCVVSADPSCLMQLRGYFDRQQAGIRCLHIAEVLAAQ